MTFVLILITHFAAGGMTPTNPPRECVAVDVLVLNRHRQTHQKTDKRGRTQTHYSEHWWWSAWDRPWGWWSPPGTWIGRGPTKTCGWWTFSNSCLERCSDGWVLSTAEGDVWSPVVLVVDSPFDWEARHRTVIVPLFRK